MRGWIRRRRTGGGASCAEVAEALQSYLDGQIDDLTARRVSRHLDHCRRCGLEAETYQAIKEAVARRARDLDHEALERLLAFGERLAEEGPASDSGSPA